MKTLLIDHDIEGQGNFLWGTLVKDGWLSLVSILMFKPGDQSPG
jgi:hypothetical protein